MKKILPLLLAVMIVVSMAVSVSATEVHAVFRFNDEIDLSVWNEGEYPFQFVCDGEEYIGFEINKVFSTWHLIFLPADGGWQPTAYSSNSGWQEDGKYQSVLLNGDYTDLVLGMISSVGTLYYECDGSACPVSDWDIDAVCDTCGMPLAYSVQRSFVPSGWPSEYPSMPVGADANSQYILMTKDDGYTYLYIFTPYEASPVSEWNTVGSVHDSMQLKMYDADGNGVNVKRLTYRLGDNGDWYQHDSQSVDTTLFGAFDEIDMVYSTLSFYKEDGTLFFPLPLWEEMEQVTQGEMMGLTTEVVGTMKVLALCGVGCLALLVVLKLFGKRSLIYRN